MDATNPSLNDQDLLQVNNLRTVFTEPDGRIEVVRGVSFSVKNGEILGIVGESGSGKSVMMKSVLDILPSNAEITGGEIIFNAQHLERFTSEEKRRIRGREIAMIFQDPMTALNPLKKIGDHLEELLLRHQRLASGTTRENALNLLRLVGIPEPERRFKQYPHEFSGGMRQRVLIAMALACRPKLLIADEPTTALDVTIQAQILDLLQDLKIRNNMAIILITHDLGVVASLCHRIIVMYAGLIMEEGTVVELFDQPRHPYTKALLNSLPQLGAPEKSRLQPIPGVAPSLAALPPGCPFAERCERVMEACRQRLPEYRNSTATHRWRCFWATEGVSGA